MLRAAIHLQLVSQRHCNTSCKEGMLHAAIHLQLVSQWYRISETSCKESMLHAAIHLQLVSQRHCNTLQSTCNAITTCCNPPATPLQHKLQSKVHRVTLAIELGSTFATIAEIFLTLLQVVG